jgi:peptidoglycan/xylan/chitin deacetylase (PgdA/CDA1 family)
MSLTVVMYHYVRDLQKSAYPDIKGRTIEEFESQLDYIAASYTVCSTRQVVSAARGGDPLPENACVLTFDDGFVDHFEVVFPRLSARGMVGSFYPPVLPIEESKVLDVHKIHFILAAARDHRSILDELFGLLNPFRRDFDIPDDEALVRIHGEYSRFNSREVLVIKRLLQKGLPASVRAALLDVLFSRHVRCDEARFAKELYMDTVQLRHMAGNGMEIGGHGYTHAWLETLPRHEQEGEIRRTRAFLAKVLGHPPVEWVMSYPQGSYNALTLELLDEAGCALGLTIRPGVATDLSPPLELPRLDTNDIPLALDKC